MTNEEANIRINKMMEDENMEKGRVKWFDATKGFGFIEREGKEDIFVHFQDIDMDGYKTLEKGELVTFRAEKANKGEIAKNVNIIQD